MTCTITAWLPLFAHPPFVEIILESWRFLQRERGVEIFGYVIMENRLHWIARSSDLSRHVGQMGWDFVRLPGRLMVQSGM